MGITGLLQFIKDAAEPINVKKYKGQTVAVDTYCWLHKGAFSCAEKLAKGEPTDQYVWYCLKFVDMLLNFSIKPILVFDGRNLPSKQEVEKARRERREANLQKGRQLLREGKLSEARDCFTRCVNITPAMAHNLIKAARARGVDCLVAPYEADAQLAYLTKSGLAQAVITEDSDLLAFGCKTVILKMDKQGNGLEIDQGNLGRCRSLGNIFTEEKFRYMCILSGCDYLPSLHGIGLGKACKLLRLAKDPDILKVIKKMGQYLKMNLVVPKEYVEGFIRANNTFLHQLVFDPVQRKVIPLNPYPEHADPASLSYAGLNPGDDRGLEMALGNLDFNTMERIDDFSPDDPQQGKHRTNSWKGSSASSGGSIWSRGFTPAPPPHAAASPHRPPSTRGQERVISVDRLLQVKRPREAQPAAAGPAGDKSSLSIQTPDSDGPDWPSVETPSPSESPTSSPPSSAKQGLQLFQWSGGSSSLETARASKSTSGLAALQQFHYKRETFSSSQTGGLPRDSPSPDKKSEDSQLDSSPSQDSAYFSQSQPPLTPCDREEAPAFDAASVRPNKLRPFYKPLGLRQTPSPCLKHVSGLSKLNSSGQLQATKTRALGPARASGLRKKPTASGKKDSPPNNENNPGVQATISGLWKNFSFKK
uniref:Exonuclease 1 n=1 Tax=Oryzias sinensis TaxID=183150 RepID=A0A8C7XEG9_9TELE